MTANIKKTSIIFLIGALGYTLIELLWRGHTHWTMAITGGACFLLIYKTNDKLSRRSIMVKCVIGSAVVTAAELTVGTVINLWLQWNVWDYSSIPLNFLGQICLLYSLLWFTLCFPIYFLCKFLKRLIE